MFTTNRKDIFIKVLTYRGSTFTRCVIYSFVGFKQRKLTVFLSSLFLLFFIKIIYHLTI